MSCGKPHDMDCSEALLRVYEYLDHEMDGGATDRIRVHLAECGPCLREYGIEEEVKALVQRSHRCDQAPGSLRSRVLMALQTQGAFGPADVPLLGSGTAAPPSGVSGLTGPGLPGSGLPGGGARGFGTPLSG